MMRTFRLPLTRAPASHRRPERRARPRQRKGRRIRVPEHLRDGVAFIRFRKMADVSGVQKEFRSNHWPVDAPPLDAVMFVVVPELVLRVPDKGLCGGCLHGSLCDLDTQSSSMVIRRPCRQLDWRAARVRESREPAPLMGRVSFVQTARGGPLFPMGLLTN
jgi:hypothetical protein